MLLEGAWLAITLAIMLAGCGRSRGTAPDGAGGDGAIGDGAGGDGAADGTLSGAHPGDQGLGSDPAVIWFEDFEEGSLAQVTARYDQVQGMARMELVTDAARGTALSLTAGGGVDAVDLYKQLPDHDDIYVRWYVKYDASVPWHHSGVWFGGYDPAMPYPSPMAGYKPNGDDRFSIAIEPVFDVGSPAARLDTYNYWMAMHSWMQTPSNDGTSYYGNSLVHRDDFTLDEGSWVCLEVRVRLNPDGASGAGAVLEIWKNDAPVARFDDAGPLGYWVADKFCPEAADGSECTDYAMPATQKLDLQLRSTTAYGINAFWPQNYITDSAMGTLRFDQMVVATARIGCMR